MAKPKKSNKPKFADLNLPAKSGEKLKKLLAKKAEVRNEIAELKAEIAPLEDETRECDAAISAMFKKHNIEEGVDLPGFGSYAPVAFMRVRTVKPDDLKAILLESGIQPKKAASIVKKASSESPVSYIRFTPEADD